MTVPAKPRWERPALGLLLIATAALYLWGLGASGWANAFYSAAVQAGATSWKAFFYGSFDSSNFITVDKPPASLWVMALSARIFGVNAWSILVPQALAGVGTVALLYATIRRWFGPVAGLVAGAVLAVTPVATLMFRFNNPDALLVLLLVGAAYAVTRAIENGRTRWLVLAGALVGFGFLTKMLQAFLVLPAFGIAYLVAGPPKLGKRLWQLGLAAVAMVVGAGWWIAIVELVPAASRPYIGGSQENSILELTLGYNGLGRITGEEVGSVGGGGGAQGGMWGTTGITRLFNTEMGGQIAWLLPVALIFLVAVAAITIRAPRTSRVRAALLIWGGWLLVTGLTFSYMAGIFHAYYNIALAPAIGALVGIGGAELFRLRQHVMARITLAAGVAVTAVWAYTLLNRSSDFLPWLRLTVLITGLIAALWLVVPRLRLGAVAAGAALAASLAGPAAYAVDTASTPHAGSLPTAGPAVAGSFGGGGGPGGRMGGGFGGPAGTQTRPNQQPAAAGGAGGDGGFPGGQGGGQGGPAFGGGVPGGGGGLLNATTPSSELVTMLRTDADRYTWVAAAVGSQNAAGYQLGSGEPVMSLGGFNGSDPSLSLAEFQQLVTDGKVHYFIGGAGAGGMGSRGGSSESQEIATWVSENFTAKTVGNATVYDLTAR